MTNHIVYFVNTNFFNEYLRLELIKFIYSSLFNEVVHSLLNFRPNKHLLCNKIFNSSVHILL